MEELTEAFSRLSINPKVMLGCISFIKVGKYITEASFYSPTWLMRHTSVFRVQMPGHRRKTGNCAYDNLFVVKNKLIDLLIASGCKTLFVYNNEEENYIKKVIRENDKMWVGDVYNLENQGYRDSNLYFGFFGESIDKVNIIVDYLQECMTV